MGFSSVDRSLYSEPRKESPSADVWRSTTQQISERRRSDNYYPQFTVEHRGETRWFDWDPTITVFHPNPPPEAEAEPDELSSSELRDLSDPRRRRRRRR